MCYICNLGKKMLLSKSKFTKKRRNDSYFMRQNCSNEKYVLQELQNICCDFYFYQKLLHNCLMEKSIVEKNSRNLFYLCQEHPSSNSRKRWINQNWFSCLPNSTTDKLSTARIGSNCKYILFIGFQTFHFKNAFTISWYLLRKIYFKLYMEN